MVHGKWVGENMLENVRAKVKANGDEKNICLIVFKLQIGWQQASSVPCYAQQQCKN